MSLAILNAEHVYLSRTVVDFHKVEFQGPTSPLSQLMKFEVKAPAPRQGKYLTSVRSENRWNEQAKLK